MTGLLLLKCILSLSMTLSTPPTVVTNLKELQEANKKAQPGDQIILRNGEWKDVIIKLDAKGTKQKPVVYQAESRGKVIITGHSQLKIGGDWLVIKGLYFTKGYAGDDPVISYRVNNDKLANNCTVSDCAINNFNNPKRMDENYWVAFYGRNNTLEGCSFQDKNNLGVLLAVILDDDRSRENFHRISRNHFGRRVPLGSNGGEIIRVGVSQHCQFNSNTQITDNFFEHCNGETEVVSIKSGGNLIKGNYFKECQGSVVLRHGDNNTVTNNFFDGNNKPYTGGVRVINKGQWVVNNYFNECRGTDFRSPLAVMNGIPNSPANRYVQVLDAVIANNSFYNCAPISFGEGSDKERTLAPDRSLFFNNLFYNTTDATIYTKSDRIDGIRFAGNEIRTSFPQNLPAGFKETTMITAKPDMFHFPSSMTSGYRVNDSVLTLAQQRAGQPKFSERPGYLSQWTLKDIVSNSYMAGASWFRTSLFQKTKKIPVVICKTAMDIQREVKKNTTSILKLTADHYSFDEPVVITSNIQLTGDRDHEIEFRSGKMESVFKISGAGRLALQELRITGAEVQAMNFISSDSNALVDHYNFYMYHCTFSKLSRIKGCENFLLAYRNSFADSIIVRQSAFLDCASHTFNLDNERDDKGYYPAEHIVISGTEFSNLNGNLLHIYRGGNDESTLGPNLQFQYNKVINCQTPDITAPLIRLLGVQQSLVSNNTFSGCNPPRTDSRALLLLYTDIVRARHQMLRNTFFNSGEVRIDKYVTEANNTGFTFIPQ